MALGIWLCAAFLLVLIFIGLRASSSSRRLESGVGRIETQLFHLPENIEDKFVVSLSDITTHLERIESNTDALDNLAPPSRAMDGLDDGKEG